jgi:hypothetical protein
MTKIKGSRIPGVILLRQKGYEGQEGSSNLDYRL